MTLEDSVVDTEAPAAAPEGDAQEATENNAQEPSLDQLLTEYDQQSEQPKKVDEPKEEDNDSKVLADYVRQQMEEKSEAAVKQDIESSVKMAKEAGSVELPDEIVDAYLRHKIQSDPRLMQAWQGRGNNRASFDSVVKALGRELSNSLGDKVDTGVTSSVNALASSVRASSKAKTKEGEPDFLNMKRSEFEEYKDKLLS